jgi:site-specific DNA recombinase
VSALCAAPFGYRYVGKATGGGMARFEVVEEEARIVRRIFAWVGLERVSLREVCRRLAEAGCRTRTGLARWDRTTVCGMLRNPAYIGQAAFGRSRLVPARPRLRPIRGRPWPSRKANTRVPVAREEWIAVPVPALVEPALFAAAQAQLEENRRHRREGRRRPGWLLQGLVVCRRCGYAFYGKMARGKVGGGGTAEYGYYRCLGTDTGIASAVWRRAPTARCAATASSWRSGARSGPSCKTRTASPPSTGAASTSSATVPATGPRPWPSIAKPRACVGGPAG